MMYPFQLDRIGIQLEESRIELESQIQIAREESTEYLQGYLDSDNAGDSRFRRIYRAFGEPVDIVARKKVLEERMRKEVS